MRWRMLAVLLMLFASNGAIADDDWQDAFLKKFYATEQARLGLGGVHWNRGDGYTARIDFTVSNDNPFAVKDVAIACDLNAPSGTVLAYGLATAYETIPAHGHKTVYEVAMEIVDPETTRTMRVPEQAARARCRLSTAEPLVKSGGQEISSYDQFRAWCASEPDYCP